MRNLKLPQNAIFWVEVWFLTLTHYVRLIPPMIIFFLFPFSTFCFFSSNNFSTCIWILSSLFVNNKLINFKTSNVIKELGLKFLQIISHHTTSLLTFFYYISLCKYKTYFLCNTMRKSMHTIKKMGRFSSEYGFSLSKIVGNVINLQMC